MVEMKTFSRQGCRKIGHDRRCFRVYCVFEGRKENSEKSDDASSKVS
jgi:hypothetical protein